MKRLHVRNRGAFAYVDGELADSEGVKLMRLHDSGTAGRWGFAGAPEEALDCACPLHLAAPDI
ncbi:hypothetical protein [Streptomyces sp. DG1A-41]|uniref:hypothetical protein n=1 Tax=Streptomyces sp. DG1A-41 TaxID=3125779 RepID=UPI0030D32829